jgi:flagellum-specific peptidoglycan hydrolase FlgJ
MSVQPARKPRPWWQQATALVTVSTGGVITGLNFVPGTPGTVTSPNGLPVHLLAMQQSASGALGADGSSLAAGGVQSGDSALRPAIVNIARHYLHLAQTKSPAEMEALIWAADSVDGVDHGQSCAAFASLTLELAAQAVGQQSWVTGGGTYPWPLHSWADVRVDPNPDSLNITSMVQDAQSHSRWHPVGDGYTPLPGDWVLFHQHVEVVTEYANGVLHTIGGDSLPNFTVNAHTFTGPLADAGVEGFIDNGHLASASGSGQGAQAAPAKAAPAKAAPSTTAPSTAKPAMTTPGKAVPKPAVNPATRHAPAASGTADIPGLPATSTPAPAHPDSAQPAAGQPDTAAPAGVKAKPAGVLAAIPGVSAASPALADPAAKGQPSASQPTPGQPSIPGVQGFAAPAAHPAPSAATPSPATPSATPSAPAPSTAPAHASPAHAGPAPATPAHSSPAAPYRKPVRATAPATHAPSSQQAFINAVAPGAMAAQQRWGVPASVTISQAIEESAWGHSSLAASYNNLFGIKGSGPAGSVMLPTQEFQNGQWVTVDAPFRVYHSIAESIDDHAQLLATSGYYTHAMADRHSPDAFANDLTGVYATDPNYGANLISIMRLYNLYRYDTAATPHAPTHSTTPAPNHPAASPSTPAHPSTPAQSSAPAQPSTPAPASSRAPMATPTPSASPSSPAATPPSQPAPSATPSRGYTAAPVPLHAHAAAAIPGQLPFGAASQAPAAAGGAAIPGLAGVAGSGAPAQTAPRANTMVADATTMAYVRPAAAPRPQARPVERLYEPELPDTVKTAFFASARTPIARAAPMYKDLANQAGISWKLLAACDWMQCHAQPHLSPVHGERLGSLNPDGTVYTTRSAALAQCAADLVELAYAVYRIDLTVPRRMSVRALADVFAAFRWGGLLRRHRVSSMEFPYSVEGLTHGHQKMRWPAITEPGAPDKPGTRFRMPFGAVPIVLSLDYRATL